MPLFGRFRRGRKNAPTGRTAEERLRLMLAHDRAGFPSGLLETLKDEIVDVISRHVEIDADNVEVSLTRGSRESRLVADILLAARNR